MMKPLEKILRQTQCKWTMRTARKIWRICKQKLLTLKKKIKEKWQGYGQGRNCPVFYFGMKRSKSMNGKGLWISAEIMAETRLNTTEKMLLAEIHNLAQLGECFASNEHFAEVL